MQSYVETREPGATRASRPGEDASYFVKRHKYERQRGSLGGSSFFPDRGGIFAGISLVSVLLLEAVQQVVFSLSVRHILWSYIWFAAILCQFAVLPTSSQCLQLFASSPSRLAPADKTSLARPASPAAGFYTANI